uniref:BTB domain-containing protein n=1 Tax=Musca domestica TaxID=7370 RepID=A0A1I8M291_MUSDO
MYSPKFSSIDKLNNNTFRLPITQVSKYAVYRNLRYFYGVENGGKKSNWHIDPKINETDCTVLIVVELFSAGENDIAFPVSADENDIAFRVTLTTKTDGFNIITRSIEIRDHKEHTICVKYKNISDIRDVYIKIENLSHESPECNMTHDFAKILASEEFSDVTLVTADGTEFKAHRFVLCARSEVFAAMFRNDFSERNTSRITIEDMDAEVMQEMLNYLYTDRKIPKQMAPALYTAANKYALLHLQDMCEQALIETMDVASVADTLRIADLHGNERLKTIAITFTVGYIKTVTGTESWKRLRQTDHQLCMDVLEEVMKQRL